MRAPIGWISPSCEHAEQLDLRLQRQFADFVEEDGAAIGRRELADMAIERAGESAALVAEQVALDRDWPGLRRN